MKRFARVAAVCLAATLAIGARSAQAQATPGAADPKMYAEFNFGPTLGHKSSAFVGGELGYRLTPDLDLLVDISHMNNVGTTELDNRAALIANFLGGTASTAYKANTFAFGARYKIPVTAANVSPYVLGAIGVANVSTEVAFTVNGTTIDPGTRPDLQLGSDLSGSTNRAILVIGFGVNVPFKQRFFGDLGYRYGQIFSKTVDSETLGSVPTQRIVLGVGVRF
jgi:opacity protein-like surface antigen